MVMSIVIKGRSFNAFAIGERENDIAIVGKSEFPARVGGRDASAKRWLA
jgi:hypothetical protein